MNQPLTPSLRGGPACAAEAVLAGLPTPGVACCARPRRRRASARRRPGVHLGAVGLALLLLLGGCASPPPAPPAPSQPFAKEIHAFLASDGTNPPPSNGILFIGSSSIRLWKSLAADFSNHPVFNRGFGGSQIIDSVNYADHIIFPYRPKHIVIYAGGNDIHGGKTPERVLADLQALVTKVRTPLPQARISYISIAPNPARWSEVDRVREANRLIEAYTRRTPKMSFINVFPHMLGPDGLPKPDIYVEDRLHMNERGYALWKELVRPYLD